VNGGLIFDHKLLWPALSPLAANRRVILYDQRGRGKSSIPPASRTSRIEFDAGDLAALPSALGIDRCHLLGHSWGAGICMLSTSYNSTNTASLTLLNSVGLTGEWLATLTELGAARLRGDALERLRRADAATHSSSPSATDPAALSEYAAAIYPAWFAYPVFAAFFTPPSSTSVTGAAASARLRREGYDWRTTIGTVPMPTLLVHGTADLLSLSMAQATVDTLGPRATLLPVANAGHNPFWEQPSIVFPAIEAFLSAAEREPPPRP
jgi:proline iminopeptidase